MADDMTVRGNFVEQVAAERIEFVARHDRALSVERQVSQAHRGGGEERLRLRARAR